MPSPFPAISLDFEDGDANPAIRLFGRRLFIDQTPLEFLAELLLVATSPKRLRQQRFDSLLPPPEILRGDWNTALEYAPRARLNLKLFAFFGASRLDSRHPTHRAQLDRLDQQLAARMRVTDDTPANVLRTLESLFLGFHGAGAQRTWSAQTLIPVCRSTVACESVWRPPKGGYVPDWDSAIRYFGHRQALFFAHGGEWLYLGLCNALRRERREVVAWLEENNLKAYLSSDEQDPAWVHTQLEQALARILNETPPTLSELAEFIDSGVDPETSRWTDQESGHERWVTCGWCPEETWHESYLYVVELLRICRAGLDLMDRTDLLELHCALHVMRVLAAQACRYSSSDERLGWPAYRLAVSSSDGENSSVKHLSRAAVQTVSKTIYDALRHPDILSRTPAGTRRNTLYAEADRRYGHKLFLALGKRVGFIVPRRGAGARFVVDSHLVRLLIVLLLPGRRTTYDTFKLAAEAHFGLAFDESALGRASRWVTGTAIESFDGATDDWLAALLDQAGALRKLSDSCAMVENALAPDERGTAA